MSQKHLLHALISCCVCVCVSLHAATTVTSQQRHYMELQVLSRHPSRPWLWGLKRLELSGEHADIVKAWVRQTRQQLRALPYR